MAARSASMSRSESARLAASSATSGTGSGDGKLASSRRCLRSDRSALRVALLATASSHGRTDPPDNRTSLRFRHASAKTADVKSSAIDHDAVLRKQWA